METNMMMCASTGQCPLVNLLPLLFLAGSIILLAVVIRYFIVLGRNVKAIRELLEERKAQDK